MVTRQLQVERRTKKVCRLKADVLLLCYAIDHDDDDDDDDDEYK